MSALLAKYDLLSAYRPFGRKQCQVKNCETARFPGEKSKISCFRFPIRDPDRCREWVSRCNNPSLIGKPLHELNSLRVCAKHFERSSFRNDNLNGLVFNAIPLPYNSNGQERVSTTRPNNALSDNVGFTTPPASGYSAIGDVSPGECISMDQENTCLDIEKTGEMNHQPKSRLTVFRRCSQAIFKELKQTEDQTTRTYSGPRMNDNWRNVCRLCSSNRQLFSLLDGEGLEKQLSHKIQKHLSITVATSGLPTLICSKCASLLVDWDELVTIVKATNTKFRRRLTTAPQAESYKKGFPKNEYNTELEDTLLTNNIDLLPTSGIRKPDLDMNAYREGKIAPPSEGELSVLRNSETSITQLTPSGRNSYECYLCIEKYDDKDSFDMHLKMVHTNCSGENRLAIQAVVQIGDKCKVCSQPFTGRLGLLKHVQVHHASDPHLCKHCGAYFSRVRALTEHLVTYHTLKCKTCGTSFSTYDQLQAHQNIHQGVPLNEPCLNVSNKKESTELQVTKTSGTTCNVSVNSIANVWPDNSLEHLWKPSSSPVKENIWLESSLEHCWKPSNNPLLQSALRVHQEKQDYRYVCKYCGAKFLPKSQWCKHLATVHFEHVCKKCDHSYSTEIELKEHDKIHNPLMACKICGKIYQGLLKLQRHINTTHRPQPKKLLVPLLCNECDKVFKGKSSLKSHILRMHTTERPFVCDTCGKGFPTTSMLKLHVKKEHAAKDVAVCEKCGKTYKSQTMLKKHMKFHSAVKPFKCDQCGMTFHLANTLRIHKKLPSHNSGEVIPQTVYTQCTICEKWLRSKLTFKYHMAKHLNNTHPYDCEFCDERFRTATLYWTHVRKHTGERPYLCVECGKSFRGLKSLQQHEQSHMNVALYSCEICGKAFKRKTNMSTHMKLHTGIKRFKCSVCDQAYMYKDSWKRHIAKHETDGVKAAIAEYVRDF